MLLAAAVCAAAGARLVWWRPAFGSSTAFLVASSRPVNSAGAAIGSGSDSWLGATLAGARPLGLSTLPQRGRGAAALPEASGLLLSSGAGDTSLVEGLTVVCFALSLAPYLAFLRFLNDDDARSPPGVAFGFAFLLIFVLGAIPAGIYCKTVYGQPLANVDAIHGISESLLAITNLLLSLGFRAGLRELSPPGGGPARDPATGDGSGDTALAAVAAGGAALVAATAFAADAAWAGWAAAVEPWNALSIPTWVVHWSSIIEWLVAQDYAWEYGRRCGNPAWKGLALGMAPLHTAGLCAMVYHLFYNAAAIEGLTVIQGMLTLVGNAALAFAAWRVLQQAPAGSAPAASGDEEVERLELGSDWAFLGQLVVASLAASLIAKYVPLAVGSPLQPSYAAALCFVCLPSALNFYKWYSRMTDSPIGLLA